MTELFRGELDRDPPFLLILHDMIAQSGLKAKIVQKRRPQIITEVLRHGDRLFDGVDRIPQRFGYLHASLQGVGGRRHLELQRREVLAEGVVDLARDAAPLFLLYLHKPHRDHAQALQGCHLPGDIEIHPHQTDERAVFGQHGTEDRRIIDHPALPFHRKGGLHCAAVGDNLFDQHSERSGHRAVLDHRTDRAAKGWPPGLQKSSIGLPEAAIEVHTVDLVADAVEKRTVARLTDPQSLRDLFLFGDVAQKALDPDDDALLHHTAHVKTHPAALAVCERNVNLRVIKAFAAHGPGEEIHNPLPDLRFCMAVNPQTDEFLGFETEDFGKCEIAVPENTLGVNKKVAVNRTLNDVAGALFGFSEAAGGLLVVGDIARNAEDLDDRALLVKNRCQPGPEPTRAAGKLHQVLRIAGVTALEDPLDNVLLPVADLTAEVFIPRPADGFVRLFADDLCGILVDVYYPVLPVEDENLVMGRLCQSPVALLAPAQSLLGAMQFSDIPDNTDHSGGNVPGIPENGGADLYQELAAVPPAHQPALAAQRLPNRQGPVQFLQPRQKFGDQQILAI